MKKDLALLMALGLMGGMMNPNQPRQFEPDKDKPVKRPCPAGCKEFIYYGYTVYALNEARAIKKCKKLADIK